MVRSTDLIRREIIAIINEILRLTAELHKIDPRLSPTIVEEKREAMEILKRITQCAYTNDPTSDAGAPSGG